LKNFYQKYKELVFCILLPLLIITIRYDDIKGSFFLNAIELIQTAGIITHSDITQGSKPRHRFDIRYQYEVKGKLYESDRVGFGFKGSDNRKSVESIVTKYTKEKKITVYFDRLNPEFSVLEPERNDRFGFILVVIIIFCCFISSIYLIKKKNK
jgi:hypothetical protein